MDNMITCWPDVRVNSKPAEQLFPVNAMEWMYINLEERYQAVCLGAQVLINILIYDLDERE